MQFFDRVTAGKTRRTADGYLVADARVARTGIQEYTGAEMGLPDRDVVRVYRSEEEVFSQDALHTYAYRPMTNDHPDQQVTAENWKDLAIGQTGGEVARDGEYVRVPLVLMDARAIADYEAGKRELSMGYEAEITFQDGVTPGGEKYDAIQRNLKMNHLALVDRARGGDHLRIGDDNPKPQEKSTMSEPKTRTIMVDGLSVETTDAGAQAIEKLQKDVADARSELTTERDTHKQAIADKDKEIAKKDAEIDDLKGKQMSDADLDKAVTERADLISKAKVVADQDYTGKSPADIRKAAVVTVLGDEAIKDKSDDYIEARFDMLAEKANADPVRSALATQDRSPGQPQDNGQSDYEKRITDAWKGNKKEVA